MGEHPLLKWLAVAAAAFGVLGFLWGIFQAEEEQVRLASNANIVNEEWRADDEVWNATLIAQQQDILVEQKTIQANLIAVQDAIRRLESDHDRIDAMLIRHLGAEAHTTTGRHP